MLKASWLEKHYSAAPAVLVLLFQFHKPGATADTLRMEALANVDLMRKNVAEHHIGVLVAWVVQTSAEVAACTEFKDDLCSKTNALDAASMLVVDLSDLPASVARLEEVILHGS